MRLAFRVVPLGVVLVVLCVLLVAPASPSQGLVVHTVNGDLQGVANGATDEWLGVPYAAAPVGALRWRPPAPVTPWSGVRDATQFGSACSQPSFDANGNVNGMVGSEDCLFLNVFVPAGTAADARLPVMVHLHPGSNFFGEGFQDGSAFTARGVIVVTLNYRLGVFGWMGHSALTAEGGGQSGEYGALDQLAALRWVHDNVADFGGDPGNVTLFGSSAGSFDTVALVASPLSQGLITRAAVQGVSFWAFTGAGFGANTLANAEVFGTIIANSVGCGTAQDVPACLRALPAATLVTAAGPGDVEGPPIGTPVLPSSPLQLLSQQPAVPLLVGFDREEDAIFFFNQDGGFPTPYGQNDWHRDTDQLVGPTLGAKARALYPAGSYDSLLSAYITMRTDAGRGCSTRRLANTVAASEPVYRYLYTHTLENDPFWTQFHASHVTEDQLLWHSDVDGFGHQLTPAEDQLSGELTDYWTNFAKTGNPNGPGLPTWPQYNTTGEPTITLDDQTGLVDNYHDPQCALLDTVSEPFPAPWEQNGVGPFRIPPGFAYGHSHALSP